ncbi:DUF4139 domain-containing protein [Mailhella sp.]|uniref:DUF4139 domain-containing protein n=1 Tax=Mailhella sp. TaxID=1981029 RepID=UPI0040645569
MRPRLFPAFLLLLSFLAASAAQARPVAVTLYPSGALVTEEESMKPQDGRITLDLPTGADESSLVFSLSQGSVLGRTVRLMPGEASPSVAALLREADALRDEMDLKYGELANVSAMRDFWSQPPYSLNAPTLELLESLMDAVARSADEKLAFLAEKEALLRADLRVMERRASALDARIRGLGKENADKRLCVLDVQGTGFGPVTVRWSYWLSQARWSPQYRLSADTDSRQVRIRMDAAITQNSGMDWNGVELTLASAEKLNSVEAPALRSWVLDAAPALYAARASVGMKSAAMTNADTVPAPGMESAGLLWKPGRVDAASGATVARLLSEHLIPVKIERLMRPTQSRDAWIEARFDDAVARELPLMPAGQATFLVDGVENARGTFRLLPDSRSVSFGVDQLIRADVREIMADTNGLKDGGHTAAETRQWAWKAVIHNAHPFPAALRVEEPASVARNAAVSISAVTSPAAVLDADRSRYVWELELPASSSLSLRYEVKAVFPEVKKP